MNKYKIKKLIAGHEIAEYLTGKKVIAVPEKRLNEDCAVRYGEEEMFIDKRKNPEKKIYFEDKFGRGGHYALCYFEWKPNVQKLL